MFVTGGDRGIGRATCIKFAEEGYGVYFSYHKDKVRAEATRKDVEKRGSECSYVQMDVANEYTVSRAYNDITSKIPYLNVLVNNAGILSVGDIRKLDIKEWERVIRIDLTGAFITTKIFLPLLEKAPWASIVNISSIAGETGNVFASVAYAAAKAGLIGLTKRLSIELAPKIRVNAVAPSFVETDMTRSFLEKPEDRNRIVELHPLMDIAKPKDIAEAVYFLATPSSGFITGQILGINGGRLT